MRTRLIVLVLCQFICSCVSADDWPQWRGPNRDGVWSESGIISEFESDEIALKWRVPISSGYSGPTVAKGLVYVTDRLVEPEEIERVHCLNWQTGERVWSHEYDCPYGGVGYKAGPRASVLVHEGFVDEVDIGAVDFFDWARAKRSAEASLAMKAGHPMGLLPAASTANGTKR